jgi:hypothetical protein
MSIRLALPLLVSLTACAVLPGPGAAGRPGLLADVQPDVRVIALQARADAGGWRVAGQVVLPGPLRPGITAARIEGLDAEGRVLVATDVRLDVAPAGPRVRPRASFCAVLPAPEGLQDLRLRLPFVP